MLQFAVIYRDKGNWIDNVDLIYIRLLLFLHIYMKIGIATKLVVLAFEHSLEVTMTYINQTRSIVSQESYHFWPKNIT